MDEKKLIKLKDEIDQAKTEISRLEGKQSSIIDSLKEEFDCQDVKQAEDLASSLEEEITDLEETIEQELDQIDKKYEQYQEQAG